MKTSSSTTPATPRRGILSLKKPYYVEDDEDEVELLSSSVAEIKKGFAFSGSSSKSNSGSKSSTSSSTSSPGKAIATAEGSAAVDGPSDAPDADAASNPGTPAPDTAGAGPSSTVRDSPLRDPDFEDVSNCEPAATSTPIPQEEVDVPQCEFDMFENQINGEIRDGKCMMKYIDFRFSREVQDFAQRNSEKYISKLRNRRIRVSKQLAYLLRQQQRMNTLIASLGDERDEIDTAIHKFKFFIDRVPF